MKKFKEIFTDLFKSSFTKDDFLTLSMACQEGDLKTLQNLFANKKIKSHHNHSFTSMFNTVCEKGYLNIVQYLLTSPDTQDSFHNLHIQDDFWVKKTCENGHLDVIKYLFTSKELNSHAKVNANESIALISSCDSLNYNLIKFFTSCPELKEHANIHAQNDKAFIYLCRDYYTFNLMVNNKRMYMKMMFGRDLPGNKAKNLSKPNLIMEIIEYFIFDLNIPKTDAIANYLNEESRDKEKNIFKETLKAKFDMRDFHNSLQDELVINADKKTAKRMKL